MHIHANNNLLLASIGAGREEVSEIQAKRAAVVRKKLLAAASRMNELGEDEFSSTAVRVEANEYEADARQGPDPEQPLGQYSGPHPARRMGQYSGAEDGSGRLFSAKA